MIESFISLETEFILEMFLLPTGIKPLPPETGSCVFSQSELQERNLAEAEHLICCDTKKKGLTLAGLEINGSFPLVFNPFSWYSHSVRSQCRAGEVTRRDHLFYIIHSAQAGWGNTARIHFQKQETARPPRTTAEMMQGLLLSLAITQKRRWCSKKRALVLYEG